MFRNNKYLLLMKVNRLRTAFVSKKSCQQINSVMRYLRGCSWDISMIEAIHSDIIDLALEANKDNKELFDVVGNAADFAKSVQTQLPVPCIRDYILNQVTTLVSICCVMYFLILFLNPVAKLNVSVYLLIAIPIIVFEGYFVCRVLCVKMGCPKDKNAKIRVLCIALNFFALMAVCGASYYFMARYVLFIVPYATVVFILALIAGVLWTIRIKYYGSAKELESRL